MEGSRRAGREDRLPAGGRRGGEVPMKVLVLGVNGFIGHHLTARILSDSDWTVYGMDLADDRLGEMARDRRFEFVEGDISINKEWIEYHIKKKGVGHPLVGLAPPQG